MASPVTSYAKNFNIYPITDKLSFDFYRAQALQMWDIGEIRIGEDREKFQQLSPRLQELVKDIVAFFAPGDGLISKQILGFLNRTEIFGQQSFLAFQMAIEVIHAHAYADTIEAFFPGDSAIPVFNAVDTLDCVRAKADFISKYMDSDEYPLAVKYLAGAISEGIFFVSLFSIIFFLRSKGLLPRFCWLNEQVSKDEFLHRDFNLCMAYRHMKSVINDAMICHLDETIVRKMLQEAIDIEIAHFKYIMRSPIYSAEIDRISGMTLENNLRYIHTLADQIVTGLGFAPMFTVSEAEDEKDGRLKEIQLPWMFDTSLSRHPNMYETEAGDYSRASRRDVNVEIGNDGVAAVSKIDVFSDDCDIDI